MQDNLLDPKGLPTSVRLLSDAHGSCWTACAGPASYKLFELLPLMPRFTVERAREKLDTSFPTANAAVKLLESLGIVSEVTGQRKNRSFSYQSYIALLTR
ncbi:MULTISPECIES: hypothetical protein [unclassified Variovorax]|uniref:hypothetical protein n=1 Tax=unclassified Variovorax TaxID=663243 RepID=UPI003F48289D